MESRALPVTAARPPVNRVRTSKYSPATFFPLFLKDQFSRIANLYFLFVSILQSVPSISTTGGVPSLLPGLLLVLCIDGVVELLEDIRRRRDDGAVNSTPVQVLAADGTFHRVKAEVVAPGDVLSLASGEAVPADAVLLGVQQEAVEDDQCNIQEDDQDPVCYIETSQLDGESNLKLKQALAQTAARCSTDAAVYNLAVSTGVQVQTEAPNPDFTRFVATLRIGGALRRDVVLGGLPRPDQLVPSAEPVALNAEHLLPQGARVRNVQRAIVMVVAAGPDCKVRVNAAARGARKRAQLESAINTLVLGIAAILLLWCFITAAGAGIWASQTGATAWYLRYQSSSAGFVGFMRRLGTSFLLTHQIIPVALFSTLRLARLAQSFFMQRDALMRPTASGREAATILPLPTPVTTPGSTPAPYVTPSTRSAAGNTPLGTPLATPLTTPLATPLAAAADAAAPAQGLQVRSMELNDELGQINMVFADKTGTLTANHMEFRAFAAAGQAFGSSTTTIAVARLRREGRLEEAMAAERLLSQHGHSTAGDSSASQPHVFFVDPAGITAAAATELQAPLEVATPLTEAWRGDIGMGWALHEFWQHVIVNHSVIMEVVRARVATHAGGPAVAGERSRALGTRLSASSPDEEALLFAARHFGYEFQGRARGALRAAIPEPGDSMPGWRGSTLRTDAHFEVLHILPYTQRRKRMSVVVRRPDERIVLYCKGADMALWPRLDRDVHVTTLADTLEGWGQDGLRTLVLAARELTSEQAADWGTRYNAAWADVDAAGEWRTTGAGVIEDLHEELECSLCLQGATAVEDTLQADVPETLELLSAAHVTAWMITGDKVETAVNIAHAARLAMHGTRLVAANAAQAGSVPAALEQLQEAAHQLSPHSPQDSPEALLQPKGYTLVVDAPVLDELLKPAEGSAEIGSLPSAPSTSSPRPANMGLFAASSASSSCKAMPSPANGRAVSPSMHVSLLVPRPPRSPAHRAQQQLQHAWLSVQGWAHRAWQVVTLRGNVPEVPSAADWEHPTYVQQFLQVATAARSVVVARARPDQKAAVVRLVRRYVPGSRTLAIGDGANDQDMIQEAHVGVGIRGREGVQAANASDYALSEFRLLGRLLLVHGQFNYARLSSLILYTLYKNIMFLACQLAFQAWCGWSGQKLNVEVLTQLLNLVLLQLPILIIAARDMVIPEVLTEWFPETYAAGRDGVRLNVRVFMGWALVAIAEGVCIFLLMANTLGHDVHLYQLGFATFVPIMLLATMRVVHLSHYRSFFFKFSVVGSCALLPAVVGIAGSLHADGMDMSGYYDVLSRAPWWFALGLLLGVAQLLTVIGRTLHHFLWPSVEARARTAVRLGPEAVAGLRSQLNDEADARGEVTVSGDMPLTAAAGGRQAPGDQSLAMVAAWSTLWDSVVAPMQDVRRRAATAASRIRGLVKNRLSSTLSTSAEVGGGKHEAVAGVVSSESRGSPGQHGETGIELPPLGMPSPSARPAQILRSLSFGHLPSAQLAALPESGMPQAPGTISSMQPDEPLSLWLARHLSVFGRTLALEQPEVRRAIQQYQDMDSGTVSSAPGAPGRAAGVALPRSGSARQVSSSSLTSMSVRAPPPPSTALPSSGPDSSEQ